MPDTEFLSIAAALFSTVATAFAAFATWKSARAAKSSAEAARQSVKASMFKERMTIFEAFLKFHGYWIKHGKPPLIDALKTPEATEAWFGFRRAELMAKFVFGDEISQLFEEYRKMAARYALLEQETTSGNATKHDWNEKRKIAKKVANKKEFENIIEMFAKYISVKA